MATTQNLTIRIGADASGAMSVLNQATQQVNNFGYVSNAAATGMNNLNAATRTTEAGIVLTGRSARESASNLGQLSSQANIVTTSMHSMTAAMGASAQSSARWVQELNNGTRAALQVANANQQVANSNERLHRTNTTTISSLDGVKSAFIGLFSIMGVMKAARYMDDWAGMEGRLKIASNSVQELHSSELGLSKVAEITRSGLKESNLLYFKMAQALKETSAAQTELLRITETTNKAVIIGGAGANESRNALIQFGQAIASNRLGGDELRSMSEQAPRLVMAIRDNLKTVDGRVGVTTAEFRKLAEQGYLTSEVMREALGRAANQIDAEFSMMPVTIGQAFTMLDNSILEFVGKGGQANGAANGIAESVSFAARHVNELAQGMTIAAGTFVVYKTAVIAAEIKTAILTATMMKNPYIAAATAIGTAAGALYAFKDSTVTVGDNAVTVGSLVQSVWENINGGIKGAISEIDQFIEKHQTLKTIIGVFSSGGTQYDMRGNPIKDNAATSLPQTDAWADAFKGRKNDLGMQAKTMDDAKKVDQWLQESLQDDLLKGLRDGVPKIAPFVETDFDKIAESKLKKASDYQKKIIEETASLKGVQAELIKAVVSVESAFKGGAESGAGAVGLMQMTPIAAKDVGATMSRMKDESYSVQAGTEFLVKQLKSSGGDLAEAWARWNWGIKGVKEVKNSHGGAFDIQFAPPETRKSFAELEATLKALGLTVSEVEKPWKSLQKTVDESAKKQENAAKKAAEEHKRILNDAPVMKLQDGIAKLNEQSKAGVLGNETYQYQLSKLFDTYENAAFGAKEFSQEQEKIDRLMTAIATPSEKFMDSMIPYIDLLKQGKIEQADFTKASLYFQAQMNKPEENLTKKYKKEGQTGYDNEIESLRKMQRELTSTEDEMYHFDLVNRKTSDGLHQLFSDNQIEQIMKMHDEVKSLKFIDDMGLSNRKLASSFSAMFGQVLTEGKSFSDSFRGMMHGMINSISSKLMDSGMSSIMSGNFVMGGASMAAGIGVGLLSSLFKDKTVDYTHASSDTAGTSLGSSDPSNSLRGVISTLYDIHAQQFPVLKKMSEEFTLMAKGVDNTIALAIKQHGSFVASTNGMSASNKSPNGSAAMVVGGLAASTAMGAAGIGTTIMAGVANAAISAGLSTVGGALGGAATAMAGAAISTGMALGATASSAMLVGGAVLGLAGGLIIAGLQYGLGKLLGIGKTKFTAIGSGIIANLNTAVIDGVVAAQSTVYNYSTVKAVTKGWFSDTTKIYDVINGIDGGLSATFDSVFNHLYEGLGSVADALGKKEEFLAKATQMTPIAMGFNFTGKKGDEISTMLSESISTMSDKIANYFFGGIFGGLQRMGEGMLQTTIRVISQAQAVIYQFGRLSSSPVTTIANGMKNLDLAAVALSDSLIAQYESSTNANDGLKNFTASMNAFYDATTSAGKKVGDAIDTVNNSISEFKKVHPNDAFMTNATANSANIGEILTHMADVQKADAKNVSASSGYDRLVALGDSIKDAFSPSQPFDESALSAIGVNTWKPLAGGDLASATWHSGQLEKYKPMLENAAKAASAGNLELKGFDVWVAAINANTLAQDKALPIVQAAGISSKADADKQLAASKTQVDVANSIIKSTTDLSSNVSVLNQNSETVNSLIQSVLKPSISVSKQNEIARGIESKSGAFATTDDLTGRLADFDNAYNTHVLSSIKNWMKTTVEFKDETTVSTAALKAYSYVMDDVTKAIQKLTESTKYIKDLKTTIGEWVTNLQVTSLGSTKSQLDAAAKNFSAKMSVINNDFMTAEQKRTALSGITGNADQYIQTIRNFYGSNKEGVDKIQAVVDQVSALPEQLDVQQLQLNALDAIKTSVEGVGLDVGSVLQPSLTALQAQYKTANALDSGALKDSMISVLDTYGTGILNAYYSGDVNRQQAVASMVNTGLSATTAINTSTASNETKTAEFSALNDATIAAGKFSAAYAAMPTVETLTKMNEAVNSFNGIIDSAVKNIGDKNFSAVFLNALNGFATALNSTQLSLEVMNTVATGINKSVGSWSKVATISPDSQAATDLAAGVVVYAHTVSKVAKNYTLTDEAKAQSYADFTDASTLLFNKISTRVSSHHVTSTDVEAAVSYLVGSVDKDKAIGATGLISAIGSAIGVKGITPKQSTALTNLIFEGADKLSGTVGYVSTISQALKDGTITDKQAQELYGLTYGGVNSYYKNTADLISQKSASITDLTVGLTTLNTALNGVIASAAKQISDATASATQITQQATATTASAVTPSMASSNVIQMQTFRDKYLDSLIPNAKDGGYILTGGNYQQGIPNDAKSKLNSLFGSEIRSLTISTSGEMAASDSTGHLIKKHIQDMPMFANGGIANQPSIFGEAGAEAAVPLPDGRTIPVTLNRQSTSDSDKETAEEVRQLRAEMKALLERLEKLTAAGNNIALNGFTLTKQESEKQTRHLDEIKDKTLKRGFG